MDELWDLIRKIPKGRVANYGALGRALSHPMSGFLVGRALARCAEEVPWWRVVGRDGKLVVHKRDPVLAEKQRRYLLAEKTPMSDPDTVAPEAFIDPDEYA